MGRRGIFFSVIVVVAALLVTIKSFLSYAIAMKRILISTLLIIFCTNLIGAEVEPAAQTESVGVLTSTDGSYDLADFLAWAMPQISPESPSTLSSFQDYARFGGVFEILPSDGSIRYSGFVSLLVGGTIAMQPNIDQDYGWRVGVDGPNVGATSLSLSSAGSVIDAVTPEYLRANGFELTPLTCFSEGGTPTNADILYLARHPSKQPTLMSYRVSTGSAGRSVVFVLHFEPVPWTNVPGTTGSQWSTSRGLGDCPYDDFR